MVGMSPATLRRWLLGYEHQKKAEPALWHPQYIPDEDGVLLGFRDLIEPEPPRVQPGGPTDQRHDTWSVVSTGQTFQTARIFSQS